MYLPSILPDEFLKGYMERATQFLPLNRSTDARLFLAKAYGLDASKNMPLHELFSWVLGIEQTRLIRSHTLENLRNAFAERAGLRFSASWPSLGDYSGQSGVRFSAKRPGICRECARCDLKDHGCSYWHRLHLIHGIEYCPAHPNCRLVRVAFPNAFKRSPEHHLEEIPGHQNDMRTVGALEHRYVAACRALLDRDRPLASYKAVCKAISDAGATESSSGRQESCYGRHPLITAINASMARDVSREWLSCSFPELMGPATTPSSVAVKRYVQRVLEYRRVSTESYLLACLHLSGWDPRVSLEGFDDWLCRPQWNGIQAAVQP